MKMLFADVMKRAVYAPLQQRKESFGAVRCDSAFLAICVDDLAGVFVFAVINRFM